MITLFSKRHFFTSAVSVLLSVFMVAVVAYGASTMDTASVGAGTSTPGAALGVKGAALIEGQLWIENIIATSTSLASGYGTITPGAEFAVAGSALFDGIVTASNYVATSTNATSSVKWSLDIASSSLQINGNSGQVMIGATTTFSNGDVGAVQQSVDPALTIVGTGSAASATGTLFVTGGAATAGQIILKATDTRCVSIMANTLANALDASNLTTANLLTAKVVPCPR